MRKNTKVTKKRKNESIKRKGPVHLITDICIRSLLDLTLLTEIILIEGWVTLKKENMNTMKKKLNTTVVYLGIIRKISGENLFLENIPDPILALPVDSLLLLGEAIAVALEVKVLLLLLILVFLEKIKMRVITNLKLVISSIISIR